MHGFVRGNRSKLINAPDSAPATPKADEENGHRAPLAMSQSPAKKASGEFAPAAKGTARVVPTSPLTPLSFMPPSPASMSPSRKESYKDLITRAISSHPEKLMTLSDIYAWIVANVDAYRDQSHIPSTQGWKNAIRHTLSFYKCFKRVKRHPSIEKPSYWTLDYSEQTASPKSAAAASSSMGRPTQLAITSTDQDASNLWSMRSDANASKEEQCIQGLLLFRTSAGFSFSPQSSTPAATSTVSVVPKYAPSTVAADVGAAYEQVAYQKYENGIGHTQATTGGTSVTVLVDTLAGANRTPLTTFTWATASAKEQEQHLKQRKPQLQKCYAETSPIQQKHESVSYVQLIANAILARPEKRATLAQIYDWLVANVSAFQGQGASPSSVGWKNAVRHTLSTRPFFTRVICEEAFGRQKPAWWTVDVEAMNSASSLRQQQQHAQLKIVRRRRNGTHESTGSQTPEDVSPTFGDVAQFGQRPANESVIRRVSEASATMLEKAASAPPEADRISDTETTPLSTVRRYVVDEKEGVFRYPSSSVSSGSGTPTTMSTPTAFVSPTDKQARAHSTDLVKNAIFESAAGLAEDVVECVAKELKNSFDSAVSPSWSDTSSPKDALVFTLLQLRRRSLFPTTATRSFARWLALLSSRLAPLATVWPRADVVRSTPAPLMDRLIRLENLASPENLLGILDVFTAQVLFDEDDECCRRTISCVVIYNFDGAVVYRSTRLYWLGCANHGESFQRGLLRVIDDCMQGDLKEKLVGDDRTVLMFRRMDDVVGWRNIHVVRSKAMRNILRRKYEDRLSSFDFLSKPISIGAKDSMARLAHFDDALTVAMALANLSPPISWDFD